MKILNPNNTTHIITLQPRFKPTASLVLSAVKETSKDVLNLNNTYTYINGVLTITFDLTAIEGNRFSLKVEESGIVIYKGNLFCTTQTPQDYKLTKNKYIYV